MNRTPHWPRPFLAGLVPLVMITAGCGGGGGSGGDGGGSTPTPQFTLGGSISGLASGGLVLANGSDTLSVDANATRFALPTPVASGSGFSVTVQTQPDDDELACSVANGSGTMGGADVSSVTVTCAPTFAISTLAGSGEEGSADGVGTQASLRFPTGVAVDASGTVYVADNENQKIRKIAADGTVSTLAGSGVGGRADGIGAAASFSGPRGIAVDGNGTVYVGDQGNNMIRKITPDGVVSTLAGSGFIGSADGTGAAASFNAPFGVAVDGSGNVYVGDANGNKIRMITPDGEVSTLAGSDTAGSADGVGTAASFSFPLGVAVDGDGNVYVADANNNKVRMIAPDGTVSTLAGSGAAGSADGIGIEASFRSPGGVAVDDSGHVYVADRGSNRVRRITPAGVVSTVARSGAAFFAPTGVAIDASGSVYVADTRNHLVRQITFD